MRTLDKGIENVLAGAGRAGLEPNEVERAVAELRAERDALRAHVDEIEAASLSEAAAKRQVSRAVEVARAAGRVLAAMKPERARALFADLDLRVTVLAQPVRTSRIGEGTVTVTPARLRIEGALGREVTETSFPRS